MRILLIIFSQKGHIDLWTPLGEVVPLPADRGAVVAIVKEWEKL